MKSRCMGSPGAPKKTMPDLALFHQMLHDTKRQGIYIFRGTHWERRAQYLVLFSVAAVDFKPNISGLARSLHRISVRKPNNLYWEGKKNK